VWLAQLDNPDRPRRLAEFEADSPRFDSVGNIFCRGTENGSRFIYRLREGHAPQKVIQEPVLFFQTISPDGAWVVTHVEPPDPQDGYQVTTAVPTAGGPPVQLCHPCEVDWTSDGESLVIRLGTPVEPTKTVVVALESGTTLPPWPARGIRSVEDLSSLRVTRALDRWIYPSGTGSAEVFTRNTTQRNIYRVPLP